jgi:hypothetical protein
MADKPLHDIDDVVRAIEEVHEVLTGRYDEKTGKYIEGIDMTVFNASHELKDISRALDRIHEEVKDHWDKLLDEVKQLKSDIVEFNSDLSAKRGTQSVPVLLISIGIIAILGTLRHWF